MASEPDVMQALTPIFRAVLRRDDLVLTPELSAAQVAGWDSFRQIEIILAAEEHWGVRFATRELDSLRSVGDLAKLVASKTS